MFSVQPSWGRQGWGYTSIVRERLDLVLLGGRFFFFFLGRSLAGLGLGEVIVGRKLDDNGGLLQAGRSRICV